jgi:hypothetical protein
LILTTRGVATLFRLERRDNARFYEFFDVPIEVEGNRAHIRAMALDGHVIETIELTAPGGN